MQFKKFLDLEEMEVDLSNGVVSKAPAENETEENPTDFIRMDIPLFIRVLEYAHENAKTDQELHELTERAASISKERLLTMNDYESLVATLRREPDDPNSKQVYNDLKSSPAVDSDQSHDIDV